MKITSSSFDPDHAIPDEFAFGEPDPVNHFTFAPNKNPHLAWSDVPEGVRSFGLICVDTDVPTVGDDVNQEGRTVSKDLPRTDFYHWVMVDIAPELREIAEGSCSSGVTPGGKQNPSAPGGARQGVTDYTSWFAGDETMGGTYFGYDGPAPPWNDEIVHHYHFLLYALDVEQLSVSGEFSAADVREAMEGHVLAEASVTGTYTMNPDLR